VENLEDGEKNGREVELKLRVDDLSALMKIAMASGGVPEQTALQINAFFDTPDRVLGMRGLVVRLREERVGRKTSFFLTAKGPGQRSGTLTDSLEEETEIDAARAAAIFAGADPVDPLEGGPPTRVHLVGFLRNTLGTRKVQLLGKFKNERTRIPVELHDGAFAFRAVLELDRTLFPNEQVHHEVEMEVPSDVDPEIASRAFYALFERAGVVGRTAPGKARRFFAALRGDRIE